jgi:hypothetical protein
MTHHTTRPWGLAAAWLAALTLAGCATGPQPLYGWGSYQNQVYEHFKAQSTTGTEGQLAALEADLQKMRSKGQTPPPGYHAHLGMLYASLGKDDQALQELQTEKGLFPESATYIDRLLAKYKK